MIGLSLSFCIMDILGGEVALEDVECIISGTRAETPEDWNELIEGYRRFYWKKDPDEGERICRLLLAEHRIDQPRTRGYEAHNIGGGHWVGY